MENKTRANPITVIRRVVLDNYKELRNVAVNKDIPFSIFMKQTLTAIVNSYPEELKKKKKTNEIHESLKISGISDKTFNELNNICANLNVDMSSLLKIETKKLTVLLPKELTTE